jgi:hypothetical protein
VNWIKLVRMRLVQRPAADGALNGRAGIGRDLVHVHTNPRKHVALEFAGALISSTYACAGCGDTSLIETLRLIKQQAD